MFSFQLQHFCYLLFLRFASVLRARILTLTDACTDFNLTPFDVGLNAVYLVWSPKDNYNAENLTLTTNQCDVTLEEPEGKLDILANGFVDSVLWLSNGAYD